MLVWLTSFPRSGNTFFRIALEKLYGQRSFSLYEDDPASLSRRASGPIGHELKTMRASPDLFFVKSHELPEDNGPAILLVRDGRDAMVSYAHFIKDYGMVCGSRFGENVARLNGYCQKIIFGKSRYDRLLQQVIEGKFFDWSAHYHAWRRRPASCAVVNFETLVKDPEGAIEQSLMTLGLQVARLPDQSIPRFAMLQAEDPKFFRTGTTGQWVTEMRPGLQELFWQRHHEAMLDAGYERREPDRDTVAAGTDSTDRAEKVPAHSTAHRSR